MQNLQQLEQQAANLAAELLKLKQAIESLKNAPSVPLWPMSVTDLPGKPAFFVSHNHGAEKINEITTFSHNSHNTYPTIEAANSAAAFSKLSRLVHHINGREVYSADGEDLWYTVSFSRGELAKFSWEQTYLTPGCLYFKNSEDRDRSMIDHEPLWIQYFTGKKA